MVDSLQLQKNWLFFLNGFLSRSDENYIAGRALWKLWSYDTAGNLLWLSIEQLVKIIITQSEISNSILINKTELKQLKNNINNTKEFCNIISNVFKRINGNHSVEGLISNSSLILKPILTEHKEILKNINKLYQNRYYNSQERATFGNWIDDADKLYFEIRALVYEEIPSALIDEILFNFEFGEPCYLQIHHQLFKDNKFLKNRKYPKINKILSTGRIVSFDGITKENIR